MEQSLFFIFYSISIGFINRTSAQANPNLITTIKNTDYAGMEVAVDLNTVTRLGSSEEGDFS